MTAWNVISRRELLEAEGSTSTDRPEASRRLLLEGSWPGDADDSATRDALDDALDERFAHVDVTASEMAELLIARSMPRQDDKTSLPGAAYFAALSLRYYLVKLLRPIVYFTEIAPLAAGDALTVDAASDRDDDYVHVLTELASAAGATINVNWHDRGEATDLPLRRTSPWRRVLGRLTGVYPGGQPSKTSAAPDTNDDHQTIVFRGNPNRLAAVARQLTRSHGAKPIWLVDELAVKMLFRGLPDVGELREGTSPLRVRQLICDSSIGRESHLPLEKPQSISYAGVDVSRPIRRWLTARADRESTRWTRWIERIDAHFAEVRPTRVVLDEDATAMARATIFVARRRGIPTVVIEHGVPCCRFGFAPLLADRFIAHTQASARQLVQWGVPADRITVAEDQRSLARAVLGLPIDSGKTALPGRRIIHPAASRPPAPRAVRPRTETIDPSEAREDPSRLLLLLTNPPRDSRPDSIALQLTTKTYRAMLDSALAAADRLNIEQVIVRPHPRAGRDRIWEAALAAQLEANPSLFTIRMASGGPLQPLLAEADLVISLGSTAGLDAARAGLPVAQLVPRGAVGFPSPDDWGLIGDAHDADELVELFRPSGVGSHQPEAQAKGIQRLTSFS